jgi:hypothetical protein
MRLIEKKKEKGKILLLHHSKLTIKCEVPERSGGLSLQLARHHEEAGQDVQDRVLHQLLAIRACK